MAAKEEIKFSLLEDDILVSTENIKECKSKMQNKNLELIKEITNFVEYKINAQKSIVYLCISYQHVENQIKKTIQSSLLWSSG